MVGTEMHTAIVKEKSGICHKMSSFFFSSSILSFINVAFNILKNLSNANHTGMRILQNTVKYNKIIIIKTRIYHFPVDGSVALQLERNEQQLLHNLVPFAIFFLKKIKVTKQILYYI